MTQVKTGDTVRIHYTGTLSDGTEFGNTRGKEPMEFQVGSGEVPKGLDEALPGMAVGESKLVELPAERAFGEVRSDALHEVPRSQIPDNIPLDIGTRLRMQSADGNVVPVTVAGVDEQKVTLDENHPLAGKDLSFDIELVSIE